MKPAGVGLLFFCSFAIACARPPAPQPLPVGDGRPAALLRAYRAGAAARHGLRGIAKLSLEGPGGSGSAKQIVALERPARLRVEVLGFLDQTLAVLATDGREYGFFRSEDRSLQRGLVHPELLVEVVGLALTPEEAVRILLGTPALPEDARPSSPALMPDGGVRFELQPAGGGRVELEFGPRAQLRRWLASSASGGPLREVRFDDYRPLGDQSFAYRVDLRDFASEVEVRVRYRDVELNPALAPELFRLAAGGGG